MASESAAASVISTPDTGVLVLQMGGPVNTRMVRPFLYRMLSDRAIMAMSGVFRVPLAGLIALTRAPKVKRQYDSIGGGSPIVDTSLRQAAALEEALLKAGRPLPVALGNRYASPDIGEAVGKLASMGLKRLIVLPLYPQYSETTTGSAFKEVRRAVQTLAPDLELREVRDYPDHRGYAAAMAETLQGALESLSLRSRRKARILFSAHGLPVRYVEAGDPYPQRVAATVQAVIGAMPGQVPDHVTCFQSRVGPVEWLTPKTEDSLAEAAKDGMEAVVLVPVTFVSDHLETLYEMDIIYRDMAVSLGIGEFVRAPALNESPAFIEALVEIVLARLEN